MNLIGGFMQFIKSWLTGIISEAKLLVELNYSGIFSIAISSDKSQPEIYIQTFQNISVSIGDYLSWPPFMVC